MIDESLVEFSALVNQGCGQKKKCDCKDKKSCQCDKMETNALADVSQDKACKILKDGSVRGHKLSDAQRRMFAAICHP